MRGASLRKARILSDADFRIPTMRAYALNFSPLAGCIGMRNNKIEEGVNHET